MRAFNRLVAKVGIAAVLFAQFAVAAYACSALTGSDNSMPAAMADDMSAAIPGCEEVDVVTPNLCLHYCQAGSQSAQTTPQMSIPPVVTMPLTVVELVQPVSSLGVTVLFTLLERETSPPPLIRFGVLRI